MIGCSKGDKIDDVAFGTTSTDTQLVSPERIYIGVSDTARFKDDFKHALENRDYRFVGVMGYALEIPGVSNYFELYSKVNGVKVIEGTSDHYPDSLSLVQAIYFRDYAQGYNLLLLDYLQSDSD
jgi:hypothetical protein